MNKESESNLRKLAQRKAALRLLPTVLRALTPKQSDLFHKHRFNKSQVDRVYSLILRKLSFKQLDLFEEDSDTIRRRCGFPDHGIPKKDSNVSAPEQKDQSEVEYIELPWFIKPEKNKDNPKLINPREWRQRKK